jgi:hypothetical protein
MTARSLKSIFAWLAGAVIITAGVGALDVYFLDQYTDHLSMQVWPSVPGVVTKSTTVSRHGPKHIRVYGPDLAFAYTVGGRPFLGRRYQLHDEPSGSKARAQRIAASFPIGQPVTVWYDPHLLNRAVLDRGFTEGDIALWNVTFPVHALALGLWAGVGSRTWWRLTRHPAGGVRIVVHPGLVRAILCKRAPMTEALGSAAAAGFILAGAAGLPWMLMDVGTLRVWLVPAIAAAGAATGLIVLLWRTALIRAGRFDLLIDEPTGLLVLPRTMGRIDEIPIPLGAVSGVTVLEVVRQEGRHKARYYQPLLRFADDGGNAATAPLVEWPDQARADRFAAWLRKWLADARPVRPRR